MSSACQPTTQPDAVAVNSAFLSATPTPTSMQIRNRGAADEILRYVTQTLRGWHDWKAQHHQPPPPQQQQLPISAQRPHTITHACNQQV